MTPHKHLHQHKPCCEQDPCKEPEVEKYINATQLLPYLDIDDISMFDIQKSLWRFYIKTHNKDFLTATRDECNDDYVLIEICGTKYIIPHNADGILIKDRQDIIFIVSLYVMYEYHLFMFYKTKDKVHQLAAQQYLLDFNREIARIGSSRAVQTLKKAIDRLHR